MHRKKKLATPAFPAELLTGRFLKRASLLEMGFIMKFNYDEYFRKEFGKRMLLARKRAKLTQVEVAEKMGAGWKQSPIKDVEKGYRMPTEENLLKFSEIYKTSLTELMYGDEDPYNIEENDFGYDFSIKHSKHNIKKEEDAKKNIEKVINKLNKNNLSALSDICDALIRHQDMKLLKEHHDINQNKFEVALEEVRRKKHKK